MVDPHRITTRDGGALSVRWWGAGAARRFHPRVGRTLRHLAVSDVVARRCRPMQSCTTKRSHGRSIDLGCGYDYDSLADDLARVLDVRDAILVGHSMVPAEIARYLRRYGNARIASLVLISSALPSILKTGDNRDGIDAKIFADRRATWTNDMPKFLSKNARSILLPDTSDETVAWIARMGQAASLHALLALKSRDHGNRPATGHRGHLGADARDPRRCRQVGAAAPNGAACCGHDLPAAASACTRARCTRSS